MLDHISWKYPNRPVKRISKIKDVILYLYSLVDNQPHTVAFSCLEGERRMFWRAGYFRYPKRGISVLRAYAIVFEFLYLSRRDQGSAISERLHGGVRNA